jgi:hypothetical protein
MWLVIFDARRNRNYNIAFAEGLDERTCNQHLRRTLKIRPEERLVLSLNKDVVSLRSKMVQNGDTLTAYIVTGAASPEPPKKTASRSAAENGAGTAPSATGSASGALDTASARSNTVDENESTLETLKRGREGAAEGGRMTKRAKVDVSKGSVEAGAAAEAPGTGTSAGAAKVSTSADATASSVVMQDPELSADAPTDWIERRPEWLVLLERVRRMPTNCGKPIRELIREVLIVAKKNGACKRGASQKRAAGSAGRGFPPRPHFCPRLPVRHPFSRLAHPPRQPLFSHNGPREATSCLGLLQAWPQTLFFLAVAYEKPY